MAMTFSSFEWMSVEMSFFPQKWRMCSDGDCEKLRKTWYIIASIWVEFNISNSLSLKKLGPRSVPGRFLDVSILYLRCCAEVMWTNCDLPHVKFIREKQTLLSDSQFPSSLQSTMKPTFWCHQNRQECKLYRTWLDSCFQLSQLRLIYSHWIRSKRVLFSCCEREWEKLKKTVRFSLKLSVRQTEHLCNFSYVSWVCGQTLQWCQWMKAWSEQRSGVGDE